MAQRTIVAYFDRRSDAETARNALIEDGIAPSAVNLLPEATGDYSRTADTSYDHRRDEGGFWASLGDLFLPDEDRYSYAEGMSRGGATLSVVVDDVAYSRTADILEQSGSVDIDERETGWRGEGWEGYQTTGATAADTSTYAATSGSSATSRADYDTTATVTGDEVIPVVEEQLRVGKRQVDKGRVRVRSYVVETPVEEQVQLHSERVVVDRRPVDRELSGADAAAFQERTIEAEERAEEAVVSKEARVVEEVAIHRETENRTETVSDTVRHTEVEVEDERTGVPSPTDRDLR